MKSSILSIEIKRLFVLIICCALFSTAESLAQPIVGRKAAAKYFAKKSEGTEIEYEAKQNSPTDHHLDIYLGKYTNSQTYEWGQHGKAESVGEWIAGVTYRIGEWHNSMDLNMRIEYQEFSPLQKKTNKLSFLPLVTFPDATSRFPLYFGLGVGVGVFMNQIPDESPLSIDYQVVVGARFFNVVDSTGFFIESGLKNHLLLLTSGQLNGIYVSSGLVFTF